MNEKVNGFKDTETDFSSEEYQFDIEGLQRQYFQEFGNRALANSVEFESEDK